MGDEYKIIKVVNGRNRMPEYGVKCRVVMIPQITRQKMVEVVNAAIINFL